MIVSSVISIRKPSVNWLMSAAKMFRMAKGFSTRVDPDKENLIVYMAAGSLSQLYFVFDSEDAVFVSFNDYRKGHEQDLIKRYEDGERFSPLLNHGHDWFNPNSDITLHLPDLPFSISLLSLSNL